VITQTALTLLCKMVRLEAAAVGRHTRQQPFREAAQRVKVTAALLAAYQLICLAARVVAQAA